jgi:hypothetical protein
MARLRLATALIAVLALTACTESDSITSPTGVLPGGGPNPPGTSGGGDTTSTPGDTTSNPVDTTGASGDPVTNGTWTNPDSTTIEPVDPVVFEPTETGSAGSSGSSTALVFKTSGSGLYGVGTCSANGFWTDPAGNVFGPHNPNCLDYGTDGAPGSGGKGICIASASGQPGLWVNPGGQQTHPFHSKCVRTGTTSTALALNFAPQAQIFDANDGSDSRVMNFYSAGIAVAQLRYDGTTNTTVGAGILVGSDNASPANTWTVFFGQPSLSYSSGLVNGDLIDDMTGAGVEVVACNTAIGCSLVTLKLTVTP